MIKKSKLPTILGIIILLVGTFAGVFFLNMRQVFKIGASADATPKEVRVTNTTSSSATVTWLTDKPTTGFLVWGTSESNTVQIEREDQNDSKFITHSITLSGLSPSTTYFFKINSEGVNYDNNGVSWQIKTGRELTIRQPSIPVSGSVISASSSPTKRALVYLNVGGYAMSTLTSDTGNFIFQLGVARSPDLQNFASINPSETLLELAIQAGTEGSAAAQIFPRAANPIPVIILGKRYDFRPLEAPSAGENPGASLSLPQDVQRSSRFSIDSTAPVVTGTSTGSVILESLDEGEVVSSEKPQFFGKGPGGQSITITVHSEEEYKGTINIPSDGSWNWSVPDNLSPGAHKVTVSWLDATGITRSLTRNFIVQAAELPAFTASGSGATATPIPTLAPRATTTPSVAPTITPTLTPAPVPETGELTPTIFLFMMSIGVLLFSFGIWKVAEEKSN